MGMFFSAKCPQCWERVDDCTCGMYGRGRKSCEGGYSVPAPVIVHNHVKVVLPVKGKVGKNNRKVK